MEDNYGKRFVMGAVQKFSIELEIRYIPAFLTMPWIACNSFFLIALGSNPCTTSDFKWRGYKEKRKEMEARVCIINREIYFLKCIYIVHLP